MLEMTKKQHETEKLQLEKKNLELMKQVKALQKSTDDMQLTGTKYNYVYNF